MMEQTQLLEDPSLLEEESPEVIASEVASQEPVGKLCVFKCTYCPEKEFLLYRGENVIGRHKSCRIHIPATSVSKKHAVIEVEADSHLIHDCGSLNKTRRRKMVLKPYVRYSLEDRDLLMFADVACQYTVLPQPIRIRSLEAPAIQELPVVTSPEVRVDEQRQGVISQEVPVSRAKQDVTSQEAPVGREKQEAASRETAAGDPSSDSDDDSLLVPATQENPVRQLALEKTPAPSKRCLVTPLVKDSDDEENDGGRYRNLQRHQQSSDFVDAHGERSRLSFLSPSTTVPESDEEESDPFTPAIKVSAVQIHYDSNTVTEDEQVGTEPSRASGKQKGAPKSSQNGAAETSAHSAQGSGQEVNKAVAAGQAATNSDTDVDEDIAPKDVEQRVSSAQPMAVSAGEDGQRSGECHQDVANGNVPAVLAEGGSRVVDKNKEVPSASSGKDSDASCQGNQSARDSGFVGGPVEHQLPNFHLDSDTDTEDGVEKSALGPNLNARTDFHMDSDTDVEEDGDEVKKSDSEPVSGARADLHMDSDTDVEEDGDEVKKSDSKPVLGTRTDLHVDSDTDAEEDGDEVKKSGNEPLLGARCDLEVDSDTDIEDNSEPPTLRAEALHRQDSSDTDTDATVQPTQCYLATVSSSEEAEMQPAEVTAGSGVEEEEEEATQFFIPQTDPFKTKVTAPEREEDLDDDHFVIAETQSFCTDNDADVTNVSDKSGLEAYEEEATQAYAVDLPQSPETEAGASGKQEEEDTQPVPCTKTSTSPHLEQEEATQLYDVEQPVTSETMPMSRLASTDRSWKGEMHAVANSTNFAPETAALPGTAAVTAAGSAVDISINDTQPLAGTINQAPKGLAPVIHTQEHKRTDASTEGTQPVDSVQTNKTALSGGSRDYSASHEAGESGAEGTSTVEGYAADDDTQPVSQLQKNKKLNLEVHPVEDDTQPEDKEPVRETHSAEVDTQPVGQLQESEEPTVDTHPEEDSTQLIAQSQEPEEFAMDVNPAEDDTQPVGQLQEAKELVRDVHIEESDTQPVGFLFSSSRRTSQEEQPTMDISATGSDTQPIVDSPTSGGCTAKSHLAEDLQLQLSEDATQPILPIDLSTNLSRESAKRATCTDVEVGKSSATEIRIGMDLPEVGDEDETQAEVPLCSAGLGDSEEPTEVTNEEVLLDEANVQPAKAGMEASASTVALSENDTQPIEVAPETLSVPQLKPGPAEVENILQPSLKKDKKGEGAKALLGRRGRSKKEENKEVEAGRRTEKSSSGSTQLAPEKVPADESGGTAKEDLAVEGRGRRKPRARKSTAAQPDGDGGGGPPSRNSSRRSNPPLEDSAEVHEDESRKGRKRGWVGRGRRRASSEGEWAAALLSDTAGDQVVVEGAQGSSAEKVATSKLVESSKTGATAEPTSTRRGKKRGKALHKPSTVTVVPKQPEEEATASGISSATIQKETRTRRRSASLTEPLEADDGRGLASERSKGRGKKAAAESSAEKDQGLTAGNEIAVPSRAGRARGTGTAPAALRAEEPKLSPAFTRRSRRRVSTEKEESKDTTSAKSKQETVEGKASDSGRGRGRARQKSETSTESGGIPARLEVPSTTAGRVAPEEDLESCVVDEGKASRNSRSRSRRTASVSSEDQPSQAPDQTALVKPAETPGGRTDRRRGGSAVVSPKLDVDNSASPAGQAAEVRRTSRRRPSTQTEEESEHKVDTPKDGRKGRRRTASEVSEGSLETGEPQAKVARGRRRASAASALKDEGQHGTPEMEQLEVPVGRRKASRKRMSSPPSRTEDDVQSISSVDEPSEGFSCRSSSRSQKKQDEPMTPSSQEAVGTGRKRRSQAASLQASPGESSASPRLKMLRRLSASVYKVMFTGVMDENGEALIHKLGGEMADSILDCTHLITDKVRRTVKFLCALARGIPIVTPNWLEKSFSSNCFLPPSGFLVKDSDQEKYFNFSLAESLQKAKQCPLLEGYEIHVTPNVKPEPIQMKDIIQCAGASFLSRMPKAHKERTVIVSCTEDLAKCKAALEASIPVVNAEFLLTGILRQSADTEAHRLEGTEVQAGDRGGKRGRASAAPAGRAKRRR
ncbi:mediator of DNA damage checkpoint protein 1 isoform X2 [Latimeria chalumnae]|uniref:mediator of DNA damage checkpoint protein 1 isoform X2 n=1 Tax=Latimeria chalumnae TaxID=7897 RepID=UPI0003C1619D